MFDFREDQRASADELVNRYERFVPGSDIEILRPKDTFHWHGDLISAHDRSLLQVACNGEWRVRSRYEKTGMFLSFVNAGGLDITIRNTEHVAAAGQALLSCVPEIPVMRVVSAPNHVRTTLKWSAQEATAVLTSLFEDATLDTLDIVPVLDLATPQGRMLAATAGALATGLRLPALHASPATELLSEAVLRILFEVFPHRFSSKLERRAPEVLPWHVKRAVDYMRAHISEPLRIQDIASACGVGARSLEAGFKRFKDTTPIAYLRQLRLEAARQELLTTACPVPVGIVALKWGFPDAARFAARYRAAFGELPSTTLRKRFCLP